MHHVDETCPTAITRRLRVAFDLSSPTTRKGGQVGYVINAHPGVHRMQRGSFASLDRGRATQDHTSQTLQA
jgi:hypothetical protein